jgi:hypothetical protein
MTEIRAVDGRPLAPESIRMLEYLKTRAGELSAFSICARVRAAAEELESVVAAQARVRPMPGKWTIAQVVDHIAQTQIRGAEELRHLLAGSRPPLPLVYEALRSGAGDWAPWELLVSELHAANQTMIDLLASAGDEPVFAACADRSYGHGRARKIGRRSPAAADFLRRAAVERVRCAPAASSSRPSHTGQKAPHRHRRVRG